MTSRYPRHAARRPVGDDPEFRRRLEEETDRSLRKDPSRWVIASASGHGPHEADRNESGTRAYVRDARDERTTRDPDDDRWD